MGALKVSTAARRVLRVARGDAQWSPGHELTATMALKIAGQLDSATGAGEVVRLTRELASLMAMLPNGTPAPAPDPEGGDGGDDEDAIDRELAEIVGTGPEVGDQTHT